MQLNKHQYQPSTRVSPQPWVPVHVTFLGGLSHECKAGTSSDSSSGRGYPVRRSKSQRPDRQTMV